jgi:Fe-S-cluster-containing hydrogenase component 2
MHIRRDNLLLEKWMNRFIIADASKCIGCRTCEVACVVSHQEHQDCAALTPETFYVFTLSKASTYRRHRLPPV